MVRTSQSLPRLPRFLSFVAPPPIIYRPRIAKAFRTTGASKYEGRTSHPVGQPKLSSKLLVQQPESPGDPSNSSEFSKSGHRDTVKKSVHMYMVPGLSCRDPYYSHLNATHVCKYIYTYIYICRERDTVHLTETTIETWSDPSHPRLRRDPLASPAVQPFNGAKACRHGSDP